MLEKVPAERPAEAPRSPSPLAAQATALLASAGRLSFTQPCVGRLTELLQGLREGDPALQLVPCLIDQVLDHCGGDVAGAVLYAAALCGQPPDASCLLRIVPAMDTPGLIPLFVGSCGGDRLEALIKLAESERLGDWEEAVCLFLAVELLGGEKPPPRLLAWLRTCARKDHGAIARGFIGQAASRIDDADLRKVAARWIRTASEPRAVQRLHHARRALRGPALGLLPKEAPLVPGTGVTLRRPTKRTGRNEPCPCQSGKKYKHCCAGREQDPSPVAGVTLTEYRSRADLYVPLAKFEDLPWNELVLFDLTPLPAPYLEAAVFTSLAYHQHEFAERALDLLEQRDFPTQQLDVLRAHVISQAIAGRQMEIVYRQVPRLKLRDLLRPADWAGLAVLSDFPQPMRLIEQACNMVLLDPDEDELLKLSHSLLVHAPALGILMARANLVGSHGKKMHELLEAIEKARDQLGLPSRDPTWALHDQLTAWRVQEQIGKRAQTAEAERLASRACELQQQVQESAARLAELERRLHEQEAALLAARSEGRAQRPQASQGPGEGEDGERRRLLGKIVRLKGLIADGNEERARLREQLAEMSDTMASAPLPGAEDEREQADDMEEEDGDAGLEAEAGIGEEPSRQVLCPVFSARRSRPCPMCRPGWRGTPFRAWRRCPGATPPPGAGRSGCGRSSRRCPRCGQRGWGSTTGCSSAPGTACWR